MWVAGFLLLLYSIKQRLDLLHSHYGAVQFFTVQLYWSDSRWKWNCGNSVKRSKIEIKFTLLLPWINSDFFRLYGSDSSQERTGRSSAKRSCVVVINACRVMKSTNNQYMLVAPKLGKLGCNWFQELIFSSYILFYFSL